MLNPPRTRRRPWETALLIGIITASVVVMVALAFLVVLLLAL